MKVNQNASLGYEGTANISFKKEDTQELLQEGGCTTTFWWRSFLYTLQYIIFLKLGKKSVLQFCKMHF